MVPCMRLTHSVAVPVLAQHILVAKSDRVVIARRDLRRSVSSHAPDGLPLVAPVAAPRAASQFECVRRSPGFVKLYSHDHRLYRTG